jgi:hemolysin activation/secretion protein
LVFANSSFAQISPIERQDQIIRQEQDATAREERQREFEKIKKEREQIKKQEEESKSDDILKVESDKCFTINSIEIIGSKSLSKKEKKKIASPFIGHCFDGSTLSNLVKEVNKSYQDLGLITAQVSIPKQNVTSGNLKIQVVEGKIEKIILNNDKFTDKMQEFTAFSFLEGNIFDVNDVNQGIYQLNRLRSNKATMKIEPGDQVGYSKIIINNENKFPASAKISYDNLGNEFTGIRKTNFSGTMENLLFLNDQINLSYGTNLDDPSSEKELKSFSSGISIPFNYNTFSYDYSRSEFKGQNPGINGPLTLTGYSDRNNIAIDRVLLNNTKYRISTNLSLTAKESASYLNNTKIETSDRKLTVGSLSFGISKYFKNGTNLYLKPQYSRGLKLLNAKQDGQGLENDIPKAQFQLYKLYGSLSKTFEIPKINLPITLSSQMDSQLSQDTLFGSEQFSVGGYYSVRGFRENFIAGDSGYYFRNKANINLGQLLIPFLRQDKKSKSENKTSNFLGKNLHHLYKLSMEPFYDYGYVQNKYSESGKIGSGRLSGAGLKTIFSSKYFDAGLTYSWSLNKSSLITPGDKENKMLYFEISAKCC